LTRIHDLAAKINEPQRKETANMMMAYDTDLDGSKWPVYVTTRTIGAGEELTAHYGSACTRAYKVGRKATKPAWWGKA
jgi:hypothetical protein